MKIAKIKVSISLTAFSLLTLKAVPKIVQHDKNTKRALIKYVLLTGSVLQYTLYTIVSLASSPSMHMILKNLNYLRLLRFEDLSQQLLIGQVIVSVS